MRLAFALTAGVTFAAKVSAANDLSGTYECSFEGFDYRPCTLGPRAEGGYTVDECGGGHSFRGILIPSGSSFRLEGSDYVEGGDSARRLTGALDRKEGGFEGTADDGTGRFAIGIRKPQEPPANLSGLSRALAVMTNREAVTAGSKFPLHVNFFDAPKSSYTVRKIDDKTWRDKLCGIFGMVPPRSNIGIKCNEKTLECTLTAQSGGEVCFAFARTPGGLKLTKIVLPAEGD